MPTANEIANALKVLKEVKDFMLKDEANWEKNFEVLTAAETILDPKHDILVDGTCFDFKDDVLEVLI